MASSRASAPEPVLSPLDALLSSAVRQPEVFLAPPAELRQHAVLALKQL